MAAVLEFAVRGDSFDPSFVMTQPPSEPFAVLRALLEHITSTSVRLSPENLLDMVLERISCSPTSFAAHPLGVNMTKLLMASGYLNTLREAISPGSGDKRQPRVVVVGAGPVGLLHALEARSLGAKVTILEKRTNYTRNMWFDLGPSSWYASLEHVKRLGFDFQDLEIITYDSSIRSLTDQQSFTIRCQHFERVLAKTAWILGVELIYGAAFQDALPRVDGGFHAHALRSDLIQASYDYYLPFDILIAADGAVSAVRQHLGLLYEPQTTFFVDKRIPITMESLNQPTLLVNLKFEANGACPKLKLGADGAPRESFDAGMIVPGVTHVFKRFYHGRCHLQVLLTEELAKRLNFDLDDSVPWPLVHNITSFLFETPYDSISDLKDHVVETYSDQGKKLEVEKFRIVIRKASVSAMCIEAEEARVAVLLVGDASITAHYRMGVGINNGVRQLHMTRRAVREATQPSESPCLQWVKDANDQEQKELDELAKFETYLIAAEALCDYVVEMDPAKVRYFSTVWLRSREDYLLGKPALLPLHGLEFLSNCEYLSP